MDSNEYFPVSRCVHYGFYYPYGNTPAEDFLENIHPHLVKDPIILVLGCGDIRSCFYTLWKNFTPGPDFTPLFSGVHFVLNDISAAVLARNIIFLHLCLQKPKKINSEDFNKWLCALWAIWFSRSLLPDHERVLSSALRRMLQYSVNINIWSSKDNPLSLLVQFTSEHTLKKVRKVWKMWSTQSFNVNPNTKYLVLSTSAKSDIENMIGTTLSIELSSVERERMECEIENSSTGYSFAEYVVGDGFVLPVTKLVANVTMHERSDGMFIMDSLLPFRCFHHAFRFTSSLLRASNVEQDILDKLTVTDERFEEYPLLANSVQQFALWLTCTSILVPSSFNDSATHSQACVKFTLHCSEAIDFCNELQNSVYKSTLMTKKFDLIYTSNLLDPICPPNVVLFSIPLLKPDAYLFTTTIKYKTLAKTTHEYLTKSFGVNLKMLPVLYGIRCINHEGEYRANVAVRSVPVEYSAVCPVFTPYYVKVIIWERVPSMIVSNMQPDSMLWHALSNSISTILSIPPDSLNHSSSQTVVKMLQMFLTHSSGDDTGGSFWDPLCNLLRSQFSINHLLNAHSLLSGLHLHLLITEETCPICNKISFSNFFGQFCISMEPLAKHEKYVYAQVVNDSEELHSTFDCLAARHDSDSSNFYFIAPLDLSKSGYQVRIFSCGEYEHPNVLAKGQLQSFTCASITYLFSTSKPQVCCPSTLLGSLKSHFGNGDKFESVILLSEDGCRAYSKIRKIYPEQLSPSKIKIKCGIHSFELSYPHPIIFNKTLSIQISQVRKTITVTATRKRHSFEDEMATLFLVNPDNKLTLPHLHLHNITVKGLMGMQFVDLEVMQLKSLATCQPLPDLKNSFNMMMQVVDQTYFTFSDHNETLCAMVMIINRVLDYQLKTPAIDLLYCITSNKSVFRKWAQYTSYASAYEINHDTIELMDKIFLCFSRRTICSLQSKDLLALKQRVDSGFKRAIVYPLYRDPDDTVSGQRTPWNQGKSDLSQSEKVKAVEEHCCSICGRLVVHLVKCDHCLNAQFCDKCEKQHLHEHKISHEASKTDSGVSLKTSVGPAKKCNYCSTLSDQLRKCSRCQSVQYCNQECQKKHWKEHKKYCQHTGSPNMQDEKIHSRSCYNVETKPLATISGISSISAKCSYCFQPSETLRYCAKCHMVQYCNKDCQQIGKSTKRCARRPNTVLLQRKKFQVAAIV